MNETIMVEIRITATLSAVIKKSPSNLKYEWIVSYMYLVIVMILYDMYDDDATDTCMLKLM